MNELNIEELDKLNLIRDRVGHLKTDRKTLYEDNWDADEKDYKGIMPYRGADETAVSLRQSFKAVNSCVHWMMKKYWGGEKFVHMGPVDINDVLTAEVFGDLVNFEIRNMPGSFFNLAMFLFNFFHYGVGVGKFMISPLKKFEWISPWDIWFNNATSIEKIDEIYHEKTLTAAELLSRKSYAGCEEFINTIKERYEKDKLDVNKILYKVGEYWTYNKIDKSGRPVWNVCTVGMDEVDKARKSTDEDKQGMDATAIFREVATPHWFGQPFIIAPEYMAVDKLSGGGEVAALTEVEHATNMIINLELEYLQLNMKPPLMYTDEAFPDTTVGTYALENIVAGTTMHVGDIDRAMKFLYPPVLSSSSFMMRRDLEDMGEGIVGLPNILSGEAQHPREPFSTSQQRVGLASGGMEFKKMALDELFMKPLASKMLISLIQNPPREKIIKVAGQRGARLLKIAKGSEIKATAVEPEHNKEMIMRGVLQRAGIAEENIDTELKRIATENGDVGRIGEAENQEAVILNITSSKNIAELWQDIQIEPYKEQDLQMTEYLNRLLTVLPQLLSNMDDESKSRLKIKWEMLIAKLFKIGGVEIEYMIDKGNKIIQQAQPPQAQGRMPQGRMPNV